ncbi:hypothetical protein ACQKLP_01200 [Chitinophaga sp. NPDC101104]|uniref:hypothetical protein n=1 Tax=Chitinophaga sp. NPDC101104 TaxID=3390561 RepID=UPI003D05122A
MQVFILRIGIFWQHYVLQVKIVSSMLWLLSAGSGARSEAEKVPFPEVNAGGANGRFLQYA